MHLNTYSAKPLLAVVDYGMGNLRSVVRAWEHVGATAKLVSQPSHLKDADALIFPGQGAIVDTMQRLQETGFGTVICDWITSNKPFFGICLGLQALFEYSEEGDTRGLGIFKGQVRRFDVPSPLKVPHMGWNSVAIKKQDRIAQGFQQEGEQFYFVHSYYVEPEDEGLVLFETDYPKPFVSGICKSRCYATQFHPEKSQAKGLHLYRNFLNLL